MQAICAADAFTRHSQQLMGQTSKQTVVWQAHSSGVSFRINEEISLFHAVRENFNMAMQL